MSEVMSIAHSVSISRGSFSPFPGEERMEVRKNNRIQWVVTKAALIKFAPIVPVSNRTLAYFPLMNVVPSRAW